MRFTQLVLSGALAAMAVASPALGQDEQDDKEECRCGAPWRVAIEGDLPGVVWLGSRARLGVWVRTKANAETDRIGAYIERVTPGGPADRAGIEAGDIVTRLDGASLLSGGGDYDEDESAPGLRLIERARELERGDTVEVEIRRGDETRTVELVAGGFDGVGHFEIDDYPVRVQKLMHRLGELPSMTHRAAETFALRYDGRILGLELVSLNPDLGEYFGADEGVLVVSVPEDSELGLKAGDVIEAIDGRKVRSPGHATRILRSYAADEEIFFDVLRKKKRTTVKGIV